MNYLLVWFNELSNRRTSFGGVPNPITDMQILAWSALTGNQIRPEEATAIFTMDLAFRTAMAPKGDPNE
tara:strand:+ start:8651 stop:8857 length:207 start_codon:yes stop_codon:yes gene_type:complete